MVHKKLAEQKREAPPINEVEGVVSEESTPPILDFTEMPYR